MLKSFFSWIVSAILLFFSSLGAGFGCATPDTPTEPEEPTLDWHQMVLDNYNEFLSEIEGNANRIPVIIHTDQHGAITADSDIYKYLDEIVDWNSISRIINLGDTVTYTFDADQLEAYTEATKCLPSEKRIELPGNHDRSFLSNEEAAAVRSNYFSNPGASSSADGRIVISRDSQYGVRYLAVDFLESPWDYYDGALHSEDAEFIIAELESDDPSDIVLLSHPYIFRDALQRRDGSTFTGLDYFLGGPEKDTDVKQSFIDMLAARKNGGSGVLLDSDGVSHDYDFSSCSGDVLMTFHGHHHTEGFETKDGLTEFVFQSMTMDNEQNSEPNCFYFAYIDRETKTFKCWKNVIGYDPWEISIA